MELPPDLDPELKDLFEALDDPTRLAAQGNRMLERIGVDRSFRPLRYPISRLHEAVEEVLPAVGESLPAEVLVERLLSRLHDEESREQFRQALEEVLDGSGSPRDQVAIQVVLAHLSPEHEGPLTRGVLRVSLTEWPLQLFFRQELDAVQATSLDEAAGRLLQRFRPSGDPWHRYLELQQRDPRLRFVADLTGGLSPTRMLWRFLHARDDLIPVVDLPFEAILHAPKARLLAENLSGALQRDMRSVKPRYRRGLRYWLSRILEEQDEVALETALAHLLGLEAPGAHVDHIGLYLNYERSLRLAVELNPPEEGPLIQGILNDPGVPHPYQRWLRHLEEIASERATVARPKIDALFKA